MDPFKPLDEKDVTKLRSVLSDIHDPFIAHVKSSRGDRLKADGETLFNGDFWVGQAAIDLGRNDIYMWKIKCN